MFVSSTLYLKLSEGAQVYMNQYVEPDNNENFCRQTKSQQFFYICWKIIYSVLPGNSYSKNIINTNIIWVYEIKYFDSKFFLD